MSHGFDEALRSAPVMAIAWTSSRCSLLVHVNRLASTIRASLALFGMNSAKSVARMQCFMFCNTYCNGSQ